MAKSKENDRSLECHRKMLSHLDSPFQDLGVAACMTSEWEQDAHTTLMVNEG